MEARTSARPEAASLARELRSATSLPVGLLWRCLKGRRLEGLRFRRQHPAGSYILDFYCPALRLAVEVDGDGHGDPERKARDERRDAWLAERGVRVLRIQARTVLHDMDTAVRTILHAAGIPIKEWGTDYAGREPVPPP